MGNIAIIPARSGSKGLKDKNIKILKGKPLLAYTIEAAIDSGMFEEVMVSTDSEEYARIAVQYGANVPFLRSRENSGDKADSWNVVSEVLGNYERGGLTYASFCLLQPTSPLRDATDIIQAYNIYNTKASFAVVSVCEAEHSPLWCGQLPASGEFVDFISQTGVQQRQAGGIFFRLNGAIYIVNIKKFKEDRFLYQKGSYAYIMEQRKSIDIDTELDFRYAEIVMSVHS